MRILVTGTPGTGKTTFSAELAEALGIKHVDITAHIKQYKLYEKHDAHFDTYIFDENTVAKHLRGFLKDVGSFIIDTHSPSVAACFEFDFIFQLRCGSEILYDRLAQRKYSSAKIQENMDCECLDMVGEELEEHFDAEPVYINGSGVPDPDVELTIADAIAMVTEAGPARSDSSS
ncbi:adenylate kinase [Pancytospora philotis]|nr:adenylate kinase [Pancytospora philotis]